MFPSRSPYLRLSILLGLFIPAFVGGLFLAFNTNDHQEHKHRHYAHDHHEAAKIKALEERLQALSATDAPPSTESRKVHKVVDQMPIFPGRNCGDQNDYKKRKQCADRAMLEYIYKNVRYPKRARDRNVSGMAVVSFIVEPHGVITNIEVVRDPGSGLGEAAAKTVRKMRKDNLRWEPGLHKGKPVAVRFNLPVKFTLE
ncbi:energy transducer TonB [Neolewinella persica]|uniref:energy transducer TonB n=1 Tax=Neolewinella persica TaxID=70998 RepID=UPI000374FA62|nr:energy transducer TonB [Neolewinella persica]